MEFWLVCGLLYLLRGTNKLGDAGLPKLAPGLYALVPHTFGWPRFIKKTHGR